MDEVSGVLRSAIQAYLNYRIDDDPPRPSQEQVTLLIEYLRYWINAPCWNFSCHGGMEAELAALRSKADELRDLADIPQWINLAVEFGIDPL